jgi:hypothetical protein
MMTQSGESAIPTSGDDIGARPASPLACPLCGCDALNGYVEGDCPDCEVCECGHNAFAHEPVAPHEKCYECACSQFVAANGVTQ